MIAPYPGFKACPTTVHDASIWTGGTYMDLVNPNPAEISFAEIARALSRIARFTGHTNRFYSVAEHCVNCVAVFGLHAAGDIYDDPYLRDIAQDVLMHDAAEAYLGDVSSPLKRVIGHAYKPLEDRMQAAIGARFNLGGTSPEWVKRCDLEMLAAEKLALLPEAGEWPCLEGMKSPEIEIWCHPPEIAERDFIDTAVDLGLIPDEGVHF